MQLQRRRRTASQSTRLFPFLFPWAADRSITEEHHGSQPQTGDRCMSDSGAAALQQPHRTADIKEQPPGWP
ncbi:hypothetical protein NDU88_003172 [Pleurodeles waltl]|uniref:Uncharacterized protein n=1 Tax=Pleurodeles waltl TaxID=8319 RepID=A0AAV7MTU0_PLEWA|nr:hypothetical protein NDU88_003172 [Pleurodeles waltl]